MENAISELLEKLNLGKMINLPTEVKGGLLHKMYRITTTKGLFAIKILNNEIMKRPKALQNMISSEKLALLFSERIPAVPALELLGHQVFEIDQAYYMVFPWIEGRSLFYPDIDQKHCEVIGDLLGKIHQMNLSLEAIQPEIDALQLYEWDKYLWMTKTLDIKENEWVSHYEQAIQDIKDWNKQVCEMQTKLSQNIVISHRDLDPKNVIWHEMQPFIIDWEAAGYINPYEELLEVICYWADDGKGGLEKTYVDALLAAYSRHMDLADVEWQTVFLGSYVGMLGWLAYNVKRSLGLETMNEEELQLGKEQVITTINTMYQHERKLALLKEWLDSDKL